MTRHRPDSSEAPFIPRPDLRAAGWELRIAYARRKGWTATELAKACGFRPAGTAVMLARMGVRLRGRHG